MLSNYCTFFTRNIKLCNTLVIKTSIYKEKFWYQYLSAKSFSGCSPQVRLNSVLLDFYLWDHLKTLVYSAPNSKEETLQLILMLVKRFSSAPGPLKGYDALRPQVFILALVKVEGILSICCESWLDNNKNPSVIRQGTSVGFKQNII